MAECPFSPIFGRYHNHEDCTEQAASYYHRSGRFICPTCKTSSPSFQQLLKNHIDHLTYFSAKKTSMAVTEEKEEPMPMEELTRAKHINWSKTGFILTPKALYAKKALVNVKNRDKKSFIWAVLASLHYNDISNNKNRVSQYEPFLAELKYEESDMPMRICNIPKFERQNPFLSINVLQWNPNSISRNIYHPSFSLIHRTTNVNNNNSKAVNLLHQEGSPHYFAITNLNRLLNQDKDEGSRRIRRKWCHRCMHSFWSKSALEKHTSICLRDNISYPKPLIKLV